MNTIMQLRKICNHPYMFQHIEVGPTYGNGDKSRGMNPNRHKPNRVRPRKARDEPKKEINPNRDEPKENEPNRGIGPTHLLSLCFPPKPIHSLTSFPRELGREQGLAL